MNINDFTTLVRKQLLKKMDGLTDIKIKNMSKDNATTLTAIEFIEANCNLSPTIYIEPFFTLYKNGKPLDSIILQIIWEYYRICIESSNTSGSIPD